MSDTVKYVISGDYGQPLEVEFIDVDTGSAADISGYTTSKAIIRRSPRGVESTETAAFSSDGTDGKIRYTPADGDINMPGRWRYRGRVTSGTAQLTSEWIDMDVEW